MKYVKIAVETFFQLSDNTETGRGGSAVLVYAP